MAMFLFHVFVTLLLYRVIMLMHAIEQLCKMSYLILAPLHHKWHNIKCG